jgi:hypothetical protein
MIFLLMTHAELKAQIEDSIPFRLHVADGRTLDIPHRDFIFLPPRSTGALVALPSDENEDETVSHVIPLLMISGVTKTVKSDSV